MPEPTSASARTVAVAAENDGARLDQAMQRAFAGMSRKLARQAILSGAVKLNGRTVKIFARKIKAGDKLTLSSEAPVANAAEPPHESVRILHQDADLLVVDKPGRLLSERVPGERGVAIADVLSRQGLGRTWLVHRLDAGTSGVMMFARNAKCAKRIAEAFGEGRVEKSYLLLCKGEPGAGEYSGALGRDPQHPRRFAVRQEGKRALTRYRTLATCSHMGEIVSLASARPKTGRTHQIRVHFADAGHVLIGDKLYGGATKLRGATRALPVERPLLHAWALSFAHPRDGRLLRFIAAPHADIQACITLAECGVNFDALDPLW